MKRRTALALATAAIVVNAAVQALLVAADTTPAADTPFVLATVGSFAAIVLTAWFVSGLLRSGAPEAGRGPARSLRLLVSSAVVVLAVVVCGVIAPPLALVPILGGMIVLPASALADARPLHTALGALRSSPGRSALAAVAALLLLLLAWGVAFALGFFVTGWPAAAVTWAWFGLSGTVMLGAGGAIVRRYQRRCWPPKP